MNEMAPVNFPGFRSRDPSPAFAHATLPRPSPSLAGQMVQHPEGLRLHHPRRWLRGDFRPPDRHSQRRLPLPPRGATNGPNNLHRSRPFSRPSRGFFRVARRTDHAPSTMSRRLDTPLDDSPASTRLSSTRPARSMPTNAAALDAAAVIREAPGGSAPTREQSHLLFREPASAK